MMSLRLARERRKDERICTSFTVGLLEAMAPYEDGQSVEGHLVGTVHSILKRVRSSRAHPGNTSRRFWPMRAVWFGW